jgi:hypothetical protein
MNIAAEAELEGGVKLDPSVKGQPELKPTVMGDINICPGR